MNKTSKIFSIIFLSLFLLTGVVSAQNAEDFQFEELGESLGDFPMFQEPTETSYEKAKVLEINEKEISEENGLGFGGPMIIQDVKLEILSGKYKDEERVVENNLLNNPLDVKVKEGGKILVYVEEFEDGTLSIYIQDHWRLPSLLWLVVGFFVILLIVGRLKGLAAILSLVFSIILIFKFFIPRILGGDDPIILALIVSVVVTIITLLLISGFKKKSAAAILGTTGGLLVATVLAVFVGKIANLTGLSSEESRMLFAGFPNLNLKGLLFAGIIIGALGAVMDIGMTIASSIAEVKKAHSKADFKKLFLSGFTVGRDIMGTMTNTLIFAYVGVSLPLLLLFTELGESYLKFINFEFMAEEIVRSMAGSIGLVVTLPLTAVIAAFLESRKKS